MTFPQWFRKRTRKTLTDASTYPPVIHTPEGPVTEAMRARAALNLKEDPEKKRQIVEMLGEVEAKRRFPEAFE